MLKRLHLQNFTVFADADFEFGPGLNVIVGTNGTGKSHVLKLGYAIVKSIVNVERVKPTSSGPILGEVVHYNLWQNLPGTFALDGLTKLIRNTGPELAKILVEAGLDSQSRINFGILSSGIIEGPMAPFISTPEITAPVLIPAKEILTFSWMLPASEQLVLPIEQPYLDLLKQLRGLPRRHPTSPAGVQVLTTSIGGEVQELDGKYYLVQTNGQRLEMNMVAEGLRKFGTLQKLLLNGSLTPKTTLFWDEPEANLNPQLLRELAKVLAELARQGFQIILATHSMSLLKEFHILSRDEKAKPLPIKYFGLNAEPGQATTIHTSPDFEFLPDVVALEVELEQADALDEIFAQDDRKRHANL